MTGTEAAAYLRVKPCTVANERKRNKLGYTRVGARVFYTIEHVNEYLKRQEENTCETTNLGQDKLEITGLARNQGAKVRRIRGAARGMTPKLDKHVVSALARRTFEKQATQ
jgi:ribosomal protein L22